MWQITKKKINPLEQKFNFHRKVQTQKIALFIRVKNVVHMLMHLESIILGGSYEAQDLISWEGKM